MNESVFSGQGQLIIRISEGRGAFPVSDAIVSVYDRNTDNERGELLYSLRSDISGLTPKIFLPAPEKSGSLSPGGIQPYSLYDIKVTKNGYRNAEASGVQIFDGITALQIFEMIPLGDGEAYNLRTNDDRPVFDGNQPIISESGEQQL